MLDLLNNLRIQNKLWLLKIDGNHFNSANLSALGQLIYSLPLSIISLGNPSVSSAAQLNDLEIKSFLPSLAINNQLESLSIMNHNLTDQTIDLMLPFLELNYTLTYFGMIETHILPEKRLAIDTILKRNKQLHDKTIVAALKVLKAARICLTNSTEYNPFSSLPLEIKIEILREVSNEKILTDQQLKKIINFAVDLKTLNEEIEWEDFANKTDCYHYRFFKNPNSAINKTQENNLVDDILKITNKNFR